MASAARTRVRGRPGPGGQEPPGAAVPDVSRAGRPIALRLRHPSSRWGPFRLQRLVLVEVAAALPLVGWAVGGSSAAALAGGVAAVLVLLAVVRRNGRALPALLGASRRLKERRRLAARTPVPPGTDPAFTAALECDPALRTYSHRGRDRRDVGMVGDGTFVTVVLQIESDGAALRTGPSGRPLPLGPLRDALEVDGIRLASAQIVLHTQPAPALHLPQQSVAVSNYAPLQARTGAPALRLTWIALKLDPELCPEAVAARGGGLAGAQKCVMRAADQLASRLAGRGFRATALSEEELTAALATSACANPLVTAQSGRDDAPQRRTEESTRSWRCDNRRHTTYWVRRWPQLGGAGGPAMSQLVTLLTAVPTLATTFSLTLGPDRQQVRRDGHEGLALRGHVRVTGRSDSELDTARRALEQGARQAGAGLVRLDHEQLPGMLATLPLGGTR
ncbi:type VII secretion protein EccE [Streptomyces silvensis]|uniref:type VII secretion protein EccE n=1 Tax=Streptomyces silvensis TaxID=1765722 RepID=UPI000AEDA03E|nr:type VII secretion protein EccE [Streptomyces silvensis]